MSKKILAISAATILSSVVVNTVIKCKKQSDLKKILLLVMKIRISVYNMNETEIETDTEISSVVSKNLTNTESDIYKQISEIISEYGDEVID